MGQFGYLYMYAGLYLLRLNEMLMGSLVYMRADEWCYPSIKTST